MAAQIGQLDPSVYDNIDADEEVMPHVPRDRLPFMTIHQAKGLEWPILFLPGLTSQRFPSSMSGRSQEWCLPDETFDDICRFKPQVS